MYENAGPPSCLLCSAGYIINPLCRFVPVSCHASPPNASGSDTCLCVGITRGSWYANLFVFQLFLVYFVRMFHLFYFIEPLLLKPATVTNRI
jgi:hypothetical protein